MATPAADRLQAAGPDPLWPQGYSDLVAHLPRFFQYRHADLPEPVGLAAHDRPKSGRAQMSTLSDVARMLKAVRKEKSWSQDELARRAGVARTTLARMETMARGDMSVSVLLRLLDAAGYDLKVVARPFDQGLAPEASAVEILGVQ